ncbi:MAG: hypothetical protein EA370_06820 [Wenzhouxiangella sp.]|nr:MAG: hypothetical protein EA370_06820 [Wenzhouxiangella sp.]
MHIRFITILGLLATLAGCGSDNLEDRIYGFWAVDVAHCSPRTGYELKPDSVAGWQNGQKVMVESGTVYEELMKTDSVLAFRFNTSAGQQVLGFNYLADYPDQLLSIDQDRMLVRCR